MIPYKKIQTIFSFIKPSKKGKYKTMVLVGSHGDVISIRRFLGLAIFSTLVSIVTVVVIIYLLFSGSSLRRENKELKEAVSDFQLQTKHLKNENDILMARLVAEAEGGLEQSEKKESSPTQPQAAPSNYSAIGDLNIDEEIKMASQQTQSKQSSEKFVEVENLVVTHESDTKTLRVRYDLRNVDPELNPVSGRTVVILKTAEQNQANWLTLPFVPLVSGKPASTTTGRTFLISRFKTVRFSIAGQTSPALYKTATVFIFSKTGETLLEKDFKVNVKEVLASAVSQDSE